jgi:hypothetical protein
MQNRYLVVVLALAALPNSGYGQVPLTEKSFHELGTSKGLVILQVNWGRYWHCGRFENAQLQKLAFQRLATAEVTTLSEDWMLSPTSSLLTKPAFEPYAVFLNPGQYALSSFRLKIASSMTDVRVAEPGPSELIVGGKPLGGSFTIGAGEAIYIGHFGVDCAGEPTPWRFYIDGSREFSSYVDAFHKHFPFTKDVPIVFRLFETSTLGKPYELPK